MHNALIPLAIAGIAIRQDDAGRYFLNDLHRASGGEKRNQPSDWLRSQQAQKLVAELKKPSPGIPGVEQNQPLATRPGPPSTGGGTYVCKELVFSYAMWISPVFHLKVIRGYDAAYGAGQEVAKLQARIAELEAQAALAAKPRLGRVRHYRSLGLSNTETAKLMDLHVTTVREDVRHLVAAGLLPPDAKQMSPSERRQAGGAP